MAKTRQIRKRIISVRNINKITRTMERVAQSKGMKLTGRYDGAASFQRNLARLLPGLWACRWEARWRCRSWR